MTQRNKVPASAEKKRPPGGSRKGKPNKITRELKDMILGALEKAGGEKYLMERAKDPRTAAAFMTLVGKVLPMQVTGAGGGPIVIKRPEELTDEELTAIATARRAAGEDADA